MNNRSSLEKSHSKVSNFKLTMIAFIASISVTVLWIGIGLLNTYKEVSITLILISSVFVLISYFLIRKFTR